MRLVSRKRTLVVNSDTFCSATNNTDTDTVWMTADLYRRRTGQKGIHISDQDDPHFQEIHMSEHNDHYEEIHMRDHDDLHLPPWKAKCEGSSPFVKDNAYFTSTFLRCEFFCLQTV